jgi:hypothetical protein
MVVLRRWIGDGKAGLGLKKRVEAGGGGVVIMNG